jgi:hypothetical protein
MDRAQAGDAGHIMLRCGGRANIGRCRTDGHELETYYKPGKERGEQKESGSSQAAS